ncbi:MAG TPA: hypothetical protein VME46_13530 [Acidimicrobiales bacterium]|nr:hypothetical protein [Acidimicrobiales bacterium]
MATDGTTPVGNWQPVTGDADMVSITNPDGSGLTEQQHVDLLNKLRTSDLGVAHPDLATWTKWDEQNTFFFQGQAGPARERHLPPGLPRWRRPGRALLGPIDQPVRAGSERVQLLHQVHRGLRVAAGPHHERGRRPLARARGIISSGLALREGARGELLVHGLGTTS